MRTIFTICLSLACLSPRVLSADAIALPGGKDYKPGEEILKFTASTPKKVTLAMKAEEMGFEYSIEKKEISYMDRDCSLVDESKIDPRWQAYESLPLTNKGERATLLQNLISGLKASEARFLVEKGYFKQRPRGWNAFRDEVKRLDRQESKAGALNELIAKQENATRTQMMLGVPMEQCPEKQTLALVQIVSSKPGQSMGTKDTQVTLTFSNLDNLGDATDQLKIVFDGENVSVSSVKDNVLAYEIAQRTSRSFDIIGSVAQQTPADWSQVEMSLDKDYRNKSLKLKFKDVQLETKGSSGRVVVEYELYRYRLLKTEDFLVLKEEKILDRPEVIVDLKNAVREKGFEGWRPGDSYYVSVRYRRIDDPRFSSELSLSKSTERLEAPH